MAGGAQTPCAEHAVGHLWVAHRVEVPPHAAELNLFSLPFGGSSAKRGNALGRRATDAVASALRDGRIICPWGRVGHESRLVRAGPEGNHFAHAPFLAVQDFYRTSSISILTPVTNGQPASLNLGEAARRQPLGGMTFRQGRCGFRDHGARSACAAICLHAEVRNRC